MELTRRERRQLIVSCVVISICIILIFALDLILAGIFPSMDSESWRYMKYFLIFPLIIGGISIIWIVKPRKLTPHVVERSEIQEKELHEELINVGIVLSGELLKIIERIAYCDPVYARKRFRKWPWRAKGRIVLTSKELIFLSVKKKKTYFSIPISAIHAIQYFVARGGSRTFKVCEIVYRETEEDQKGSVLFMGTIGFSTFDYPSEIELKSMKLMETLEKWYETWVED